MIKSFFSGVKNFFTRIFGGSAGQRFVLETSAMLAGALVAKKNPSHIAKFIHYHKLFQREELSVRMLNNGIEWLQEEKLDPLLANRLIELAKLIGIEFSNTNYAVITDISKADAELLRIAMNAFIKGAKTEDPSLLQ